jgi:hypothetical protein
VERNQEWVWVAGAKLVTYSPVSVVSYIIGAAARPRRAGNPAGRVNQAATQFPPHPALLCGGPAFAELDHFYVIGTGPAHRVIADGGITESKFASRRHDTC